MLLGSEVGESWALRDVSFEVSRRGVSGVIERKGAGKGTLLRMLGRTSEPTRGRVLLRGRVASLLEAVTGLYQELTGRENVSRSWIRSTECDIGFPHYELARRSYRSGGRKFTCL